VSVVVAAITAVLFGLTVDKLPGGAMEMVTVMVDPAVMLTVAWADFVESVTEVAMMVTEPPDGTAVGAV